jgi:tetratricopeptide (TPR) repeat protein
MLGCTFHLNKTEEGLLNLFKRTQPFDIFDIKKLGMRVKHMNIVDFGMGITNLTRGLMKRARDTQSAINSLKIAVNFFEKALSSNTNSKVTLRKCALTYLHLSQEYKFMAKKKTENSFELREQKICVDRASSYFLKSISIDDQDSESLFEYANFCDKTGEKEKAEQFYKKALLINSNYFLCRKCYGDLLNELNRPEEAEEQYLLARKTSNIQIN